MKFEAQAGIERPISEVFVALTEFEAFERSAMRRGADVQRVSDVDAPLADQRWEVEFSFRGAKRKVDLLIQEVVEPTLLSFLAEGSGMTGVLTIKLSEVGADQTGLSLDLELKSKTLAARLMLQSLKLAKGKLNKKLNKRVGEMAAAIETNTLSELA